MPNRSIGRLLALPAVLVVAALGARLFVAEVYRVPSRSMEPALEPGDQVVVTHLGGTLPRRGDVVVFEDDDGRAWIKRVIGLPGDSVVVEGAHVSVNGTTLTEPWAGAPSADARATHLVPAGHYFVMGDNRANSDDSRAWGFVAGEAIVGRARLICWSRAERGPVRWGRLLSTVD
ncbi:MAG: signal peptidase I [Thermoanaerobaculia bacterium]